MLPACAPQETVPTETNGQDLPAQATQAATEPAAATDGAQMDHTAYDISITEVMPDNRNLLLGHEMDWVELYNPEDLPISLEGSQTVYMNRDHICFQLQEIGNIFCSLQIRMICQEHQDVKRRRYQVISIENFAAAVQIRTGNALHQHQNFLRCHLLPPKYFIFELFRIILFIYVSVNGYHMDIL